MRMAFKGLDEVLERATERGFKSVRAGAGHALTADVDVLFS